MDDVHAMAMAASVATSSEEESLVDLQASSNSGEEYHVQVVNGAVNDGVIKGVGMIGKIVNDKSGIIWWLKSSNHLQSVWFEAKQTFLFGTNLSDKNLLDIFKEGELFNS